MLLIFACAYGLRRNAAWSMFGKSTSSTYNPCPVSRRGSSLRLIRSPKYRVAINSPVSNHQLKSTNPQFSTPHNEELRELEDERIFTPTPPPCKTLPLHL